MIFTHEMRFHSIIDAGPSWLKIKQNKTKQTLKFTEKNAPLRILTMHNAANEHNKCSPPADRSSTELFE